MKRTCSVAVILLAAICGFADQAQAAPPTISSVSPTSGTTDGGTQVTITGTDLSTVTSVTFGGAAATIGPKTATSMIVTTPAHVAGAVDVVVTNPEGFATKPAAFTYIAPNGPAPTVASVSPNKGTTVGGTAITITGTNFRKINDGGAVADAKVQIGGVNATSVVIVSATTITADTPASQGGASGAFSVTVTNSDSTSGSLINGFTYSAQCDVVITVNCIDQLLVDNASPPAGVSGELLGTSTGLQVSIVNSASSDRFELSPTVTTAKEIKVVLKVGTGLDPVIGLSTGDIQNQGLKWNATTRLATLTLKPRASSWSADPGCSLPPGTCAPQATVDYNAFALMLIDSLRSVDASLRTNLQGAFLSTNAQAFSTPAYDSAAGGFSFQVAAPSTRKDNTPNINGFFNFFIPDSFITNVWGLPNPDVLLDPQKSKVTIKGEVVTPKTADVIATSESPAGIKLSFEGFSYSVANIAVIVAPTVSAISPTSGTAAGGTAVTITGLNFRAGATVTIGGVAATNINFVNSTTLTAKTGARGRPRRRRGYE